MPKPEIAKSRPMILLNPDRHTELVSAIYDNIETPMKSPNVWDTSLGDSSRPYLDGFLALQTYLDSGGYFPTLVEDFSTESWLNQIEIWQTKYTSSTSQNINGSGDHILWTLWHAFTSRIHRVLQSARRAIGSTLPDDGGLLAFIGGMSHCIVFRYTFAQRDSQTPTLRIVTVVPNPTAVFDFWDIANEIDSHKRGELKYILSTAHKVIVHRGVLVHIDRRIDLNVFGPSIDTVLLAEVLIQQLLENDAASLHVFTEIGCGNGLLTAILANYFPNSQEVFGVDINVFAISCTWRNAVAGISSNAGISSPSPTTRLIVDSFDPDLLNRKFDLIVCNPPYIPMLPFRLRPLKGRVDYSAAIGGTDLLRDLLTAADSLLNSDGRILVMISHLTKKEPIEDWLPSGLRIIEAVPEGFEVPFDLEDVLEPPHDWLNFLITDCGLVERHGAFFHTLHPMWVEKNPITS